MKNSSPLRLSPLPDAEFDYLEGDATADRFLLLGHIDYTATAFADLFKKFVTSNAVSGLFCDGHRRGAQERRDGRI